jgi:hypothetical protein
MRTVLFSTALSCVPMMALAQAPAAAPAAAAPEAAVAPAAPIAAPAPVVEAPKEEATKVGGMIRASMLLSDSKDGKAVQHYGLGIERARLMFSKTKGNVEGVLHLRLEANQNDKDNEGKEDASTKNGIFENVNRVYINFKDVAPGLNVQVGKKLIAFGDDADYGLAPTDAVAGYGTINSGYGLGLFADYALPEKLGTVNLALINGNGKTNTDNNSQKGFVLSTVINPIAGLGVNLGYAVNVPEGSPGKNAKDTYIVAGVATKPELTVASLGLDWFMRKYEKDGKLVDGKGSGSGIAAKATYKIADAKVIAVYNMLTRNLEDETNESYYYYSTKKGTKKTEFGVLDSKTKTPKASTYVLAAEYNIGAAFVGLQYKGYTNDAELATDKDGKVSSKTWGDAKLYTQLSF